MAERLVALRKWLSRFKPPRRVWPTKAGIFALIAPIVLGAAAINAGNNLLFILLSGALALISLSGMLSEKAVRGIDVDIRVLNEVWAREPCRRRVRLQRSRFRS